jgi:hypothetical protein
MDYSEGGGEKNVGRVDEACIAKKVVGQALRDCSSGGQCSSVVSRLPVIVMHARCPAGHG